MTMNRYWFGIGNVVLAVVSLLLTQPVFAQEPIGVVLVIRGEVKARAVDGTIRTLSRRVPVFESDTVLTGSDAYAQLRLNDDALLALGRDTEFTFDQYRFDNDPATPDTALMSLLRGCFQTVTGMIGDNEADEYRIDTPLASIHVKGTFHTGVIANDVLYTGAYEGGTRVANSRGYIDLGIGSDYDFSRTVSGAVPEGLVSEPAEFACQTSEASTATMDQVINPSAAPSAPADVHPGP